MHSMRLAVSLEERVVALEMLPQKLQTQIDQQSERFVALNAAINAERASVGQMRSEALERHEAEFKARMDEEENQLKLLKSYVDDAQQQAKGSRLVIASIANEEVAALGTKVKEELDTRIEEHSQANHSRPTTSGTRAPSE